MSNLLFVAKIVEKAVINQSMEYCTTKHLLPDNQSSYRKHHSTEKALVKVKQKFGFIKRVDKC